MVSGVLWSVKLVLQSKTQKSLFLRASKVVTRYIKLFPNWIWQTQQHFNVSSPSALRENYIYIYIFIYIYIIYIYSKNRLCSTLDQLFSDVDLLCLICTKCTNAFTFFSEVCKFWNYNILSLRVCLCVWRWI